MHFSVVVIGPDPEAQMEVHRELSPGNAEELWDYWVDWGCGGYRPEFLPVKGDRRSDACTAGDLDFERIERAPFNVLYNGVLHEPVSAPVDRDAARELFRRWFIETCMALPPDTPLTAYDAHY